MAENSIQQLSQENLPRHHVGPDPDSYANQNAQADRNYSDSRGLTADIEAAFAEGKTQRQVQNELRGKMDFVPPEDRTQFLANVRATLGIPSRGATEGETDFNAWKAQRDERLTNAVLPSPTGPSETAQPNLPHANESRQDPLPDMLQRLADASYDHIRPQDPNLDAAIQRLAIRSLDPQQISDPAFHKATAVAVEGFEKLAGPAEIPDALRQEFSSFSTERRLETILKQAETIGDPSVLAGVRARVEDIAKQLDKNAPEALTRLDGLEIQINRLAPAIQDRPDAQNANTSSQAETPVSRSETPTNAGGSPTSREAISASATAQMAAFDPEPDAQAAPTAPTLSAQAHAGATQAGDSQDLRPTDNDLRKLVEKLDRSRPDIEATNPQLGKTIRELVQAAGTPNDFDADFMQRLAYAIQDAQRIGINLKLTQGLQSEFSRLATSMDGLKDSAFSEILRNTPNIADQSVVNKIRAAAASAVKHPNDSSYLNEPLQEIAAQIQADAMPQTATNQPTSTRPRSQAVAESDSSSSASAARDTTNPNRASSQAGAEQSQPNQSESQQQRTGEKWVVAPVQYRETLAGRVSSALQSLQPAPSPSNAPQTNMVDRLDAYEARKEAQRQIDAAYRAGHVATEALKAFSNGPGAAILSRIQDAARADPGGMPAVLSEMRAGGRYADLRQQFNGALSTEQGLAGAYERAAAATVQYDTLRAAIAPTIANHKDTAALTKKFQALDTEIVEAASAIPGKNDGATAFEEWARKAGEAFAKVIDKIRGVFQHPSPSPGPSPSP
jgi:hypothetical protein